MDKKYCPQCGVENLAQSAYCKNCGTRFSVVESSNFYVDSYASQMNMHKNIQPVVDENYYEVDFEGITGTELYAYTNNKRVMNKFANMKFSDTKFSWCWSAAALTFLLGSFGAAIWFFYRKMYKWALCFLALSVVMQSANYIILGKAALTDSGIASSEYYEDDSQQAADSNSYIYFDFIKQPLSTAEMIWNTISSAINFTLTILVGIFSLHLYKNHCIKRIKFYRKQDIDKRFYYDGLMTIGGNIGWMVIIPIIGMLFVEMIIAVIFALIL